MENKNIRKQKVHVKITEELYQNIRKAREEGLSYRDICRKFNVSLWACRTYLGDIKQDKCILEKRWKVAESEAESILKSKGFKDIINLIALFGITALDLITKHG